MSFANNEIHKKQWLLFVFTIISLKLLIFLLDPFVMFFYGDSQSYLHTALFNSIPMDRSFSYGLLIKLITLFSHSLTSLVIVQVAASALSAILVAFILQEYFAIKQSVANAMGLLCAIEPIQLMFERYVMTESFSLLIFVVYFGITLHYLRQSKLILLVFLQIVGTALISLRLSYLPLVQLNTLILPLLIIPQLSTESPSSWKQFIKFSRIKSVLPVFTLHLIVSVGLFFFLHLGYKHLNGFLSKRPPAYQYHSGFFLLADWAPVIKPEDFPRPDLTNKVFGGLTHDLANRRDRGGQRWSEGGIISNIRVAIPDYLEAERVAKQTAVNALKRDPVGVFFLAMAGFKDYWDLDYLHKTLVRDRDERPMKEDMLKLVRENYNIAGEKLHLIKTLTNVYYINAWPWYLFLLCSPILVFISVITCSSENRKLVFVVFLASSLLAAISISLIERPTVRYLQPVGWMAFIVFGVLLNNFQKKRTQAKMESNPT